MFSTVGQYLARISEHVLREDADGRTLYFPWGAYFRGFVVETAEERQRVLILNTLHVALAPAIAILAQRFGGWPGAGAALVVLAVTFGAAVRVILRKAMDTAPARTPRNKLISLAEQHSGGWLAAMAFVSGLLALGGVAMIAEGQTVFGTAALIFFASTGGAFLGAIFVAGARETG
jgi:hypothetical protein